MNLVRRFDDPRPKTLKVIGQTSFFSLNVNKISKVGHSDLFLICDTLLPKNELGTNI